MQQPAVGRTGALSPEAVLGPYVVEGFLGRGGMGEVYRANDPRLGRAVAIKVLAPEREASEEALRRFESEVLAIAALSHKGICTIYDVGVHAGRPFLVMELLQGETLEAQLRRKRLPVQRMLDIAIQLADAVAYAHERGVIHRDIKSANILLTERGDAKILDFGIAKFAGSRAGGDSGADGSSTEPGLVLGTMAYMSPEQMLGEPIDARSDLFSLGVVLYEMAAGVLPQKRSSVPSLVELLGPDPVQSLRTSNPEVPEAFDNIVRRALEKEPALRFQTAGDLLASLRALRRDLSGTRQTPFTPSDSRYAPKLATLPKATQRRAVGAAIVISVLVVAAIVIPMARGRVFGRATLASIAVLPCRTPPNDRELAYQCKVLREDLIAALSDITGLLVKPADQSATPLGDVEVGRGLQVDAVLTIEVEPRQYGAVRTFDVPIALLGVREGGAFLWGRRYTGVSWDQLNEMVRRDAQDNLRLRVSKADGRRLEIERTLQTARYYWDQRSDSGLRRAIRLYERIITDHDTIARAHAGLAKSYVLLSYYGGQAPRQSYGKAKAAAARALELDPGLADAHATLGLAKRDYDRDWGGAEQELARAVELDPNDATSRQWYAELMAMTGRFAAAESSIVKATQLAPVQLAPRAVHGWILLCAGRLDDSERSLRETLELNPDYYLTNWFLGEALAQQGKLAAAIEVLRKARLLSTDAPRVMADLADVYGRQGQKDSARVILQQLLDASHGGHQISHYELAIARLGLGDAEGALRDLDAALAERTWQAANIMVDPMLQSLRLHPRFASLVRKAGLSPIW